MGASEEVGTEHQIGSNLLLWTPTTMEVILESRELLVK